MHLLADNQIGKSYCFELDNSISQISMQFSAPDRESFDEWVNLMLPLSNQDAAETSDDDIALLANKFRQTLSSPNMQITPP